MIRLALLLSLASCDTINHATGGLNVGKYLPFLESVYECDIEGPQGVVRAEYCFNQDEGVLERSLGEASCWPTERHSGGCQYSCPPKNSGCNAYNSCYCLPIPGIQ